MYKQSAVRAMTNNRLQITHSENSLNKPIRTVHQHKPRKTLHAAKADAKSGKKKSGQSPLWRKCRSIRAKLNARKAERENRGRSWMGWRPQQKWQWSKKWKEKGQIFCDSISKEHTTMCFLTACRVRHYLTLGLRSWNVEWGAFPVITETRIKLPEKYVKTSPGQRSAHSLVQNVNLKGN